MTPWRVKMEDRKEKLTHGAVGKLPYVKPTDERPQYKVSDTAQSGFMVKVGRDCRTYSVQASVGGKTKGPVAIGRYEDGVLTENARRAAQQIIHAWRDGDAATAERIVEACRRGEEITTATLARPATGDA